VQTIVKNFFVLLAAALILSASCGSDYLTEKKIVPVDETETADTTTVKSDSLLRYIRIVAMASPFNGKGGEWRLNKEVGLSKDYTAQDILEVIADLKPHRLERLLTGYASPDFQLPVRDGMPPMSLGEFLNKAMAAGAPGCDIAPKLDLNWLAEGKTNQNKFFWDSAQKLYDMKLDRPIRCINLDCWNNYVEDICPSAEDRSKMFKRLRDIGYEEIGVNMTGHVNGNDPEIDYVVFTLKKDVWMPNTTALERVQSWPNIKKIFMYIDYPEPFTEFFTTNTPDFQANIYTNNIYPNQRKLGFTYAWPIFQGAWDATAYKTDENGPYKGKTIYEVFKELMHKCD